MSGQVWGRDTYDSGAWPEETTLTKRERKIAIDAVDLALQFQSMLYYTVGIGDGWGALAGRYSEMNALAKKLRG